MKGILFKPDMIQAIIEGRKTQTRRLIKPQPVQFNNLGEFDAGIGEAWFHGITSDNWETRKPRYQVGETAYIKEAWASFPAYEPHKPYVTYKSSVDAYRLGSTKWKSPLFMPEWAARYFLEITEVRAERLQEIRYLDIFLEGVPEQGGFIKNFKAFERLWNSINKDYPWESNPWVWVYIFELQAK